MPMCFVHAKRKAFNPQHQIFPSKRNGHDMFACLLIPDFPVQAGLLLERKDTREVQRRSPIAVLDGPSNLLKVVALNQEARNLGIEIGMTKLQVETCGGV